MSEGEPPFSYSWSYRDDAAGHVVNLTSTSNEVSHSFWVDNYMKFYTLQVEVTDALNRVEEAERSVAVSPSGCIGFFCGALTGPDLPEEFNLGANSPNPFRESTTIVLAVPEAAHVTLGVYDVMGREVRRPVDGVLQPGWHNVSIDASGLSSGVYMIRMLAEGHFSDTGRMVLVR